jgi:hypothetical protein
MLSDQDKKEIAEIRTEIDKHVRIKERASAAIEGQRALLKFYQARCGHPNGYKTSSMGDTGFHCPDCDYTY